MLRIVDGTVLTSVVAAAASVIAAVIAAMNARSASKTSNKIATLQHRVVEVDTAAGDLKTAYENFTRAMYQLGSNPDGFHESLAALTALRGCVGASQELKELCEDSIRIAHDLAHRVDAPSAAFADGGLSARFRDAYEKSQEALSSQRRSLLGKR